MTPADVAAARAELLASSDEALELQTARTWAARAMAAYGLAAERCCPRWLLRAGQYHHEAGEHASGVSAACVVEVEAALAPAKAQALARCGG
jgi:hypothetical protein